MLLDYEEAEDELESVVSLRLLRVILGDITWIGTFGDKGGCGLHSNTTW